MSYIEFIKLVENYLIKLDKNTCYVLKNAIESREQSRDQMNPFNLKKSLKTAVEGPFNISYKILNDSKRQHENKESQLINKRYINVP